MPFVLLFGPGCGVKPSMFSMCKIDGLFKLKIVDHQAIRSLYYCICSCALQRPLLLQMPNPFLNNLNILDSDTDDEDECHESAGTPLGTHAGREALGLQDARTAIRT
jgi:hypothetical protein